MKDYYFIIYRVDISNKHNPLEYEKYEKTVINKTPFEYSLNNNISILFAQKISKEEYKKYKDLFR